METKQFNEFICISEENYESSMKNLVLPYIKKYESSGYFKGVAGVNLFYRKFELPNPVSSVVIVHGFTENTHRYDELIYYFLKWGCSVYIYDQRCHGLSDRLSDKYNMVYVKKFDDYVQDLKTFLDMIDIKRRCFLYGHSMGGTVVTRFLQTYPECKVSAVLSAPMLDIIIPKHRLGDLPSDINNFTVDDIKYCPGQGDFDKESRLGNPIYKDYPRYIYNVNFEIKNPELITSGASFGWFKEAFKATKDIFKPENIESIKAHVHLFSYVEDKTVLYEPLKRFSRLISDCSYYRFFGAEHNVYYMNKGMLRIFLKTLFDIFCLRESVFYR